MEDLEGGHYQPAMVMVVITRADRDSMKDHTRGDRGRGDVVSGRVLGVSSRKVYSLGCHG